MFINRIFITDCEGPISKNDNAFEITKKFVPKGDKLFSILSKYDDVLVDIIKKSNYKAGDTLRLILPFLKSYGITNRKISDYSTNNILLVPGAKETLNFLEAIMPSFIISTSYEQYISALCTRIGFPFENTYCTSLNIDKYYFPLKEIKHIKKLGEEISDLPMIKIPDGEQDLSEFSQNDQKTIERLDEIFWKVIPEMESGRILFEVDGVSEQIAKEALYKASAKLPIKTKTIKRFV